MGGVWKMKVQGNTKKIASKIGYNDLNGNHNKLGNTSPKRTGLHCSLHSMQCIKRSLLARSKFTSTTLIPFPTIVTYGKQQHRYRVERPRWLFAWRRGGSHPPFRACQPSNLIHQGCGSGLKWTGSEEANNTNKNVM